MRDRHALQRRRGVLVLRPNGLALAQFGVDVEAKFPAGKRVRVQVEAEFLLALPEVPKAAEIGGAAMGIVGNDTRMVLHEANRLKVLFDALRLPKDKSEIPSEKRKDEEGLIHCLLEDDRLITDVSVSTDRLLTPLEDQGQGHVHLSG